MAKKIPCIPTALVWLAALGVAGGSIYSLHQNTRISLVPGKILESFGFVPTFTKEEAAESYLKSVCPTNSAREKLAMRVILSNPNAAPDPEAYRLAEKYYQANSVAVSALNANNKRWPGEVRHKILALIEEFKSENNLLYAYLNFPGSASEVTNAELVKGMKEIQNRSNPRTSILVRMHLGLLNVDCQ